MDDHGPEASPRILLATSKRSVMRRRNIGLLYGDSITNHSSFIQVQHHRGKNPIVA